jgi:hypothetical protein
MPSGKYYIQRTGTQRFISETTQFPINTGTYTGTNPDNACSPKQIWDFDATTGSLTAYDEEIAFNVTMQARDDSTRENCAGLVYGRAVGDATATTFLLGTNHTIYSVDAKQYLYEAACQTMSPGCVICSLTYTNDLKTGQQWTFVNAG